MNSRIAEAIEQVERFMGGVDDALALPREAARFVHTLLLAARCRSAAEIGTSYGYSGLWMGAALAENGGRLITIDKSPRKCEVARANFARAGLEQTIEVRLGDAREILSSLEHPVDFVLNDADKAPARKYVELLIPRLTDRAIILTDNTGTHPDELRPFLEWIRSHEGFTSVNVPIGNGMELSIRRLRQRAGG